MHIDRLLEICASATVRRLSRTVLVVAVGFVVILDAVLDLLLVIAVTTVFVVVLDAELLLVALYTKKTNTL